MRLYLGLHFAPAYHQTLALLQSVYTAERKPDPEKASSIFLLLSESSGSAG